MARLQGQERARYVTRMFARISKRYDLMNTVMTGGRHYAWRHLATNLAVDGLEGPALDVATGTGDFAIDLARKPSVSHVTAVDYTPEMMAIAAEKAKRKGLAHRISLAVGDAHALPLADEQFICATVGFGIRNFIDLPKAFSEMVRVVRPGGRVVVLEIVRIEGGLWGKVFPLHFRYVTPWMGALLSGDREAYTYLPESVKEFRSANELAQMMEDAGLANVSYRKLALGAVAIHVGEKP